MTRRLLLAALLVFAASPVFAQRPSHGWGPSWVGGGPPGGFDRPTDLKGNPTAITLSGRGVGMEVTVWGDVAKPQKGHEYELRYQLRVHTKKGGHGPMLGTTAVPGGIAPVVAKGTGGADWWGLEGKIDLYRRDLSGMSGLPDVNDWDQTVFLRVEPQLYDATDKKYLTDAKTPAAIVVASVGKNRKVHRLEPLAVWVADKAKYDADKVTALLGELDVLSHNACGIAGAMLPTLQEKDTKKEVKVKLVSALSPDAIADRKMNYDFCLLMEEWAKGDDAGLKAAAKKVLGEK